MNSVVNAFIYDMRHVKYRKAFEKILLQVTSCFRVRNDERTLFACKLSRHYFRVWYKWILNINILRCMFYKVKGANFDRSIIMAS